MSAYREPAAPDLGLRPESALPNWDARCPSCGNRGWIGFLFRRDHTILDDECREKRPHKHVRCSRCEWEFVTGWHVAKDVTARREWATFWRGASFGAVAITVVRLLVWWLS